MQRLYETQELRRLLPNVERAKVVSLLQPDVAQLEYQLLLHKQLDVGPWHVDDRAHAHSLKQPGERADARPARVIQLGYPDNRVLNARQNWCLPGDRHQLL